MSFFLSPLSSIYGRAAEVRSSAYRRGWLGTRRLSHPVISVGNLTLGGTGKTPLVALMAKLLLSHGVIPAILTRGYARKKGPSLILLDPANERAPDPREVGDEPALLAAALPEVPIAVCADRYRGGRAAEARFQIGAFLLDDGFQHLRLARDLDIVALDGTQEISRDATLPAGRQRERLSALTRAHAAVITRAGQADSIGIEQQARGINSAIKIFHSDTKLLGWVEVSSGRHLPPNWLFGRRVCAFCAIGNPQAFFRDLVRWGMELAGAHAFRDHHAYTNSDVAHLVLSAHSAGGATLVTTAKDVMNLPPDWKPDMNAFACLIEAEIAEKGEFEAALLAVLPHVS
ncbi:MAG: tetraacyldisaccharide 4'-kinase [Terriglobia bacterium]